MNIQYLPPSSLTPYEFNNKKHPKEQIDLLINSIKDFGFTQPVVVDQDNVIIIGHARTKAAQILKLETIPVVVREDLDPIAIKKTQNFGQQAIRSCRARQRKSKVRTGRNRRRRIDQSFGGFGYLQSGKLNNSDGK